jgi:hypothetical protein
MGPYKVTGKIISIQASDASVPPLGPGWVFVNGKRMKDQVKGKLKAMLHQQMMLNMMKGGAPKV